MKGFKILEIIKVELEKSLLELYFNIIKEDKRMSFTVTISDDGETLLFQKQDYWIKLSDIKYDAFTIKLVNDPDDNLIKLNNNIIEDIKFGIGELLYTHEKVIYYFMIITDKNNFLFFNNGDAGHYSFDKIEEILMKDIFGYAWSSSIPPRTGMQLQTPN